MKALQNAGELVEVPDHPFLALMCDPSDTLTGRAVMKLAQTHLDVVGDAFLMLEREKVSGALVGMWPLPPSAVMRLPDYSCRSKSRRT
jgi:hypothetical protein